MNALLLSHNGLGDNITMIGLVNFLLKYYDNVYFLCKDIHKSNVELFFQDKPVIVVPFDGLKENEECAQIIEESSKIETNDIFICGFAHDHLKKYRRIRNKDLLEYKPNDKNYEIKYKWIENFYKDARADNSIYYQYFDIPTISSPQTRTILENNIIFAHTKSSTTDIQIDDVITKYQNDDHTIIICANRNVYPIDHAKYETANQYVNIPIVHYTDIIKRASEIHIVDSCFSCIVYPLQQMNCLLATTVVIYDRPALHS